MVIPIPTPLTRERRWLKNVAARMAAGVTGYSLRDLERAIDARHDALGPYLDPVFAEADREASMQYALAVRDTLKAVLDAGEARAEPPRRGPQGGKRA
jgi:hypothetical protein